MLPEPPLLIALTDAGRAPPGTWLERLEAVLAGARPGGVWVVLRDPALPVRERLDWGRALAARCRVHGQSFGVADRLDLAVLLAADGVHLGESSVSVEDARGFGRQQGRRWWVSRACHDPEQARTAAADALLLSPICQPRKGRAPLGRTGIERAVAARARRPPAAGAPALYALGGVGAAEAPELLAAGATGIAVIGAIFAPPEPLLAALGARR